MSNGDQPPPDQPNSPPRKAARSKRPRSAALELLPPPVSDGVIDGLVTRINGLARTCALDLARAVGLLIVADCYQGDLAGWRDRGEKDTSFRKLKIRAEAGDIPIGSAGLYRAVALVELEARLGVSSWKHLSLSHIRLVFGLTDGEQADLLARGEEQLWTLPRMEREVRALRQQGPSHGGRPPDLACVRAIRQFGRMLDTADHWGDLDKLDSLDTKERRALSATVAGMRKRCEELEERLGVVLESPT